MSSPSSFLIAGRTVGNDAAPYMVAELSANHNGDIARAFAVMEAAKDAGADAVKLQTYTADTITIDHDGPGFRIASGTWRGRTLHELYREAQTPWDWHAALFEKGRALGITVFSSPFDSTAVDLLESLGAPAYKIASFELIDLPLIERVAAAGKPIIMSTGMASRTEIGEAVEAARRGGSGELALLHCVSAYPAAAEDYNLRTIPDMAVRFDTVVGLSDHTIGDTVAVAAVALGAAVIEKHLTLRRADGGPDAAFSAEPEEFTRLCRAVRTTWNALGEPDYHRAPLEEENAIFRRSLYVVEDVPAGGILTVKNVRSIRPGFGLAPKHLDAVLGRRAKTFIARGTALNWALIEGDPA